MLLNRSFVHLVVFYMNYEYGNIHWDKIKGLGFFDRISVYFTCFRNPHMLH
jgi:hypothetical protein